MKIDIDGVQAFVLVAERGGFHKAAAELHLSQTALSRRVQKLERYLGLRLLDRTTRSVALTRVGREFLPRAARLVADLAGSLERLKDMSRAGSGEVIVACIPSMTYQQLPQVIRGYAERHPGNRVRLLDRSSAEVIDAVRTGEAEIGIGLKLGPTPDLDEATVGKDPFVLYCRADHPLSVRREVTWKDLLGVDLVTIGGASGNRALLEHRLRRYAIDLDGRFEVEHPSTAVSLVASGVGAAVLPAATLLTGSFPDVMRVPLARPIVHRTIVRFVRRGLTLSPAAHAFNDMLATDLAAPAWGPSAGGDARARRRPVRD